MASDPVFGATSVAPLAPTAGTIRGQLSLATKLIYGLGEAGEGVKTAALETFLFFYYVQVVGLSGTLTGAALFAAQLVDGFSDPWVGALSDRTRTRLGRRHPFLYAAPVPMAVALYFLFSPPAHLSGLLLPAWLAGFTIAARVAMTLYFVPHMALGAELSRDFAERVALGGWRTVFGNLGRIAALALAFTVFFHASPGHPNGQLNPLAYTPFALVCGALAIVLVIGSALGTQKVTLRLAPLHPVAAGAPRGAWHTFVSGMRSPSFRALFVALLVMYLFSGVQGALALHMNTYFWRLQASQVQLVFYASLVGFILGVPLAKPLANRFDKKAAYIIAIASACIVASAPTILRLIGLFPANGQPSLLWLLVGTQFAYGLIGSVPVVLSAAMLGDLADEYELNQDGRSEGVFFGVNAFCRKASLGFGGTVAGMIIDLVRFPAKAAPSAVPPEALLRLGVIYGPVMLAVLLVGLTFLWPYSLSRERHQAMVMQIAERRARSIGPAGEKPA